MPLLVEDVPSDKKLLGHFISPKMRPNGKYSWKFCPYHCKKVTTQIHGSDFTEYFVPVIGVYPVY